jgi:hypothetical protein
MTETTAEVLARQKAEAEAQRANGNGSISTNVNTAPPAGCPSGTPATAGANPWIEVSSALDKVLGAPMLKFTKQGEFALSDTDTVPEGTRCTARIDEVQFGWIRWAGNQVMERRMFRVADRQHPPLRNELGDTDKSQWEIQDGEPRDPWQFQAVLPLTRLDTDESYSLTTGSKGGLGAINKLVRTYGNRLANGRTGLPVIELNSGKYKHSVYGWIYFPVLHIVNWTDDAGKPLSRSADLNDAIPFN